MEIDQQRNGPVGNEPGHEHRESQPPSADQQAALHRVARIIAEEAPPAEVFEAVAEEAARLLDADIAAIDRFDPDGMVTLLAARGVSPGAPPVGSRTPLSSTGNAARVHATGRAARIDRYTSEYSPVGYQGGFRSAVSVPITVGGCLWGVMTVASRTEANVFPEDTESRLTALTELVALALANAQAREALAAAVREQLALRQMATLVARGVPLDDVFAGVAEAVARLTAARAAYVLRNDDEGMVEVCGAWSDQPPGLPRGARLPLSRIDPLAIACRIQVQDHEWGLLIVVGREGDPMQPSISRQLEAFADLVAIAITSTQARLDLEASRARVVASADETRRKIERDIHDGAQQRLVALSLSIRAARQLVTPEQSDLGAQLDRIGEGLISTLDELREFSRGARPAILSRGRVESALKVLARRSPIPVELSVGIDRRLPDALVTTVYYTVAEALTNTAKHANAEVVEVDVCEADGELRLTIRDDGIGGADLAAGTGLIGLRDRIEAASGQLTIYSPDGEGTEIEARLPLPREDAAVG